MLDIRRHGGTTTLAVDLSQELGHVDDGLLDVSPRWDVDEALLGSIGRQLRKRLTLIHEAAGYHLDLTPTASAQAVDKLLGLGRVVASVLFRRSLDKFQERVQLVAQAALLPTLDARIVEVKAPARFTFPFELIPWAADDGEPDPAKRSRTLVGMSGVVRRRMEGVASDGVSGLRVPGRPLSISVLRHSGLVSANEELAYLTDKNREALESYGPWPTSTPLAAHLFARHLLNSRNGLDGKDRATPSAILHLACHADTTNEDPYEHTVKVADDDGGAVSLYELFEERIDHIPGAGPLVFLNACGSAPTHTQIEASFAKFFLDNESIGVIGTLCDISDEVAGHYAMVFYEWLLRGSTVGEAMYKARWHLMEVHGNPLGLLYTFWGTLISDWRCTPAQSHEPARGVPRSSPHGFRRRGPNRKDQVN